MTEKEKDSKDENSQDRLPVLMNDIKFQCSQCGACCRRAGKSGMRPDRGDGACIHLTKENLCAIYDTRPELCNMEAMYLKRKEQFPDLDKKEYFSANNIFCNTFMDTDKMPESYRIDISKYDIRQED